ncbi:MAG: lipopolysaccharide heptosyltransferase II [Chlamydiae bacterium]|nr:lipopolysaccharide heptosyltransferase II [Chlamydiota bacterium]MBI3265964.1 lipopolysaccharide heptosyltransferase II [Chlamydiota bacterium]
MKLKFIPRRILMILPNWIGDVLFTTPAIRELKLNFPHAAITAMVWPSCVEVLRGNPDLNEILPLDEKGFYRGFKGKVRLLFDLRKKNFDTVFIFHRSRTRAIISFLAGIPQRVGYQMPGRARFLNVPLPHQDYDLVHRVDYYLGLVRVLGPKIQEPVQYVFSVGKSDENWASLFLSKKGIREGDLKIVMNPAGNWAPKRWSPSLYGRLARLMMESWNARVILIGTVKDEKIFQEMRKEAGPSLISVVGDTNLREMAALLKASDLYVGNDSGPTHLAHAMKVPLIALFGPQDPKITGPYGEGRAKVIFRNKGCQVPCYRPECETNRCIDEITVEEVFQAAAEILKGTVTACC